MTEVAFTEADGKKQCGLCAHRAEKIWRCTRLMLDEQSYYPCPAPSDCHGFEKKPEVLRNLQVKISGETAQENLRFTQGEQMKADIFETAARYAANLARLSREPKRIKLSRNRGGNQEQECARRRRFYERHGCMPGGGPRWEDDPRNPRRGFHVGTVIFTPGPGPQDG